MNGRKPYVSGYFYPSSREALIENLKNLFMDEKGAGIFEVKDRWDKKLVGVVSPHAGYMYSGYTATFSYKKIAEHGNPKKFIIIGPNHTGNGNNVSVYAEGFWETPLGNVNIDEKLAYEVVDRMENARVDEIAHLFEHSIEVQLPFLQFLFGDDFTFVPICLKDQRYETTKKLADALLKIKEDFVIIASSDLNHYEDHRTTYEKDMVAIKAIESRDTKKFYEVLEKFNISACGLGSIATLMNYANSKDAKPFLLDHKTSGEVSGDLINTVGYASIAFERTGKK